MSDTRIAYGLVRLAKKLMREGAPKQDVRGRTPFDYATEVFPVGSNVKVKPYSIYGKTGALPGKVKKITPSGQITVNVKHSDGSTESMRFTAMLYGDKDGFLFSKRDDFYLMDPTL